MTAAALRDKTFGSRQLHGRLTDTSDSLRLPASSEFGQPSTPHHEASGALGHDVPALSRPRRGHGLFILTR